MGPAGREVAAAVARLRAERGITQAQLSDRVTAAGRPLGRQTIAEIEILRRRVDVDDLAVLAAALGTSPEALMGDYAVPAEGVI